MSVNPPKSSGRRSRSSPQRAALATLPPGASADTKMQVIAEVIKTTGLPPRQAAMSVGISSSAYYRLCEATAFVDAMDEATAIFARRMGAVIARAGARGSHKAAEWWLERRLSEWFGPRLDLRVVDTTVEEELEVAISPELRAERLRELIVEGQRRLAAETPEAKP